MRSPVEYWIAEAEEGWLDKLDLACREVFSTTFLPSHDHRHHRRVWLYARMILRELDGLGSALDDAYVEAVLHAAWFHDTGMAIDPGPVHGKLGADLYQDFLEKCGEREPSLKTDILEAIRLHDNKERLEEAVFHSGERPALLQVLSVADDLDALGLCGIYRYAEIYLLRGSSMEELGQDILENADIRCRNLLHSCRHMPGLLQKIRNGCVVLQTFFEQYKRQVEENLQVASLRGGALQKIRMIREMSLDLKKDPADFVHLWAGEALDEDLVTWFKELSNALENPDI